MQWWFNTKENDYKFSGKNHKLNSSKIHKFNSNFELQHFYIIYYTQYAIA